MDIDLGEKPVANVKVGSKTYEVKLPTVRDAQWLQDELKKEEGKEVDVMLDFIDRLGLPKDVGETLTPLQLQKLSDGLIGTQKKT